MLYNELGFFSHEETNRMLLHEKPLWKKKSIIQYRYSYEKTEMLFSMKTDMISELAIVFICEKNKKIVTVISTQN